MDSAPKIRAPRGNLLQCKGWQQEAAMRGRIERVMTNDPGIGVVRHADAGYEAAQEFARREGIRIPQ